ncbi:hypothetical protein ScPMuIL_009697 [Solemya velum]
MAYWKHSQPRKKRRANVKREAPFPVPIATLTGEPVSNQNWYYYTGELRGDHVIVYHSGDIHFLYSMGFFGKGNLSSRGKPDFDQREMSVNVTGGMSDRDYHLKIMERRRYVVHHKWATGEDIPNIGPEVEDDVVRDVQPMEREQSPQKEKFDKYPEKLVSIECGDTQQNIGEKGDNSSNWGTLEAEWDDQNPDEEFWTCQSKTDQMARGTTDIDFWESGEKDKGQNMTAAISNTKKSVDNLMAIEKNEDKTLHEMTCVDEARTNEPDPHNNSVNFERNEDRTADETICINVEEPSKLSDDVQKWSDDEQGERLVIGDIESHKNPKKLKSRFFPVRKKDPYPLQEFLMLTLEEAYFLSYGLGSLILLDEMKRRMGLTELWRRFCTTKVQFLPHYVAYHYFRSKGWVPKTGLKFGVDFILYKEGPPFYHGSYSAVVKFVEEEQLEEIPKYISRKLTWVALSGLNRLTEQVGKDLLFCYVIKPGHLSDEDMMSPKCISQFKVQEVQMSRWVSAHEREKTVEEMP